MRKIILKKIALFAFLWLLVGFTAGTATLMGPVRWIAEYARTHGWTDNVESIVVYGVIIAYVIAAALIAFWLSRVVQRSRMRHVRAGIPALVLLSTIACVSIWMSPAQMTDTVMADTVDIESNAGSAFTFGPFATEQRMRALKREGYTGVISLLHPAVVPFETKLIADGKEYAKTAGLDYIHIPMLPWVSDNTESLARIEELATSKTGRYYVHCYLGQDRVRIVKRVIEESEPDAILDVSESPKLRDHGRLLAETESFERGKIVQLADGVFLTPYPTDGEFLSFIVPGVHGHVVSLLDPNNADDLPWIEKEQRLLEGNRIPFRLMPLPLEPYDPHWVLEIAQEVARLPRPMVIHGFLSASSKRAPTIEAFQQAFQADVPPLPPTFFSEPMRRGEVEVIAPNVAVGPRPREREFTSYLEPRGVREFVYVDDKAASDNPADRARTDAAQKDKEICDRAGLSCRSMDANDPDLIPTLAANGPWYLYGPSVARVQETIADELGPAIGPAIKESIQADSGPTIKAAMVNALANASVNASLNASIVPSVIPGTFLQQLQPDLKTWVLLGPVFLLIAALAGLFVGWLRTVKMIETPYTRKIFHLLIFTAAVICNFAGGLQAVVVFGSARFYRGRLCGPARGWLPDVRSPGPPHGRTAKIIICPRATPDHRDRRTGR